MAVLITAHQYHFCWRYHWTTGWSSWFSLYSSAFILIFQLGLFRYVTLYTSFLGNEKLHPAFCMWNKLFGALSPVISHNYLFYYLFVHYEIMSICSILWAIIQFSFILLVELIQLQQFRTLPDEVWFCWTCSHRCRIIQSV